MSLEDCKKAYIDLSEKAFTKNNLIVQLKNKVTVGAQFKTKALEDAIKSIVGNEWEKKLLKDKESDCSV